MSNPIEEHALGTLRLAWGTAYDIGHERGQWVTTRRDDGTRTFTAQAPDALNRVIRADAGLGTP